MEITNLKNKKEKNNYIVEDIYIKDDILKIIISNDTEKKIIRINSKEIDKFIVLPIVLGKIL